jgi:hypothetical protein
VGVPELQATTRPKVTRDKIKGINKRFLSILTLQEDDIVDDTIISLIGLISAIILDAIGPDFAPLAPFLSPNFVD